MLDKINKINKTIFLISLLDNFTLYYGFYFFGKLISYRKITYSLFKTYSLFATINTVLLYDSSLTKKNYNNSKRSYYFFKNINKRKKLQLFLYKMFTPLISIKEVYKLNILRQLWCKSFKGKCHVKGKPVFGQNNWSNGWSSYKSNMLIRKFLNLKKTKRRKKRLFKKLQKSKKTAKRKLNMHFIPKPVKKKPVKKKKFDIWS